MMGHTSCTTDTYFVAVSLGNSLQELRDALSDPQLPTIDIEALLDKVFECVVVPKYASECLGELTTAVSSLSEDVCEKTPAVIDHHQSSSLELVNQALTKIVAIALTQIKNHGYSDKVFAFSFSRILSNDQILLRKDNYPELGKF